MSEFVAMFYQGKPMPKWIWVFELSTAALMNTVRLDDLRIRGELILDATSNPWPTDFVAFHWINDDGLGSLDTMSELDATIDQAMRQGWKGTDTFYRPMTR